jgi:phosphoribosylpyrophosphate synthetase
MNFEQKYLKYKEKYLSFKKSMLTQSNILSNNFNLKFSNQKQSGGAYEKYILLSCPEFNPLVDDILIADGASEDIKEKETPIQLTSTDTVKYELFLKDIGVDSIKAASELEKYKNLFLRYINNTETSHFFRGYINWKLYSDKTPDLKMNANTTKKLRGAKVIYFAYFSFNESASTPVSTPASTPVSTPVSTPASTPIIDQFLFLNALNHYGVAEINIVLPYFPVGTMERIVGEGEIPTAYSLAHLLNSIPEGAAKNNLYMFDIHALCSRFFFHTNTRPILLTIMPEYLSHIETKYRESESEFVNGKKREPRFVSDDYNIIVFPDDGAQKRFGKMIPEGFKTITCTKIRNGELRTIKIDQEGLKNLDPVKTTGKTVNLFIIDDLVQSGGTLLETCDGLRSELANSRYALLEGKIRYITMVTYSVFPNDTDITNFFTRDKYPANLQKMIATEAKKAAEESREPVLIPEIVPVQIHELITTNSRPLRTAFIQKNYPSRVKVINLAPSLNTIFTKSENTDYYGRFSIS